MKKYWVLGILFVFTTLMLDAYAAAADGYYQLGEVTHPAWDGTTASRLDPPTTDYDYAYGDDESASYNLPWNVQFYGRSYSGITADTNGNVWFNSANAAYSINLTDTGRGPVIATWNNDLSSSYYGGVFIEHKTNPERVVIEWNTETYAEEGLYSPNNFAVVLYPDGTIRFDYKSFTTESGMDSGSGISRGDGSAATDITSQFGNVFTLSGRSFLFAPQALFAVTVAKDGAGSGTVTSDPAALNCGTICNGNFPPGTSLVLTATPSFGSEFDTWTGTCAGSNPCVVAIDGSTNVTATFKETYAPLVVIGSPSGSITSASPTLSYQVSTGTVVVMVDGVVVNKVSGDLLDGLVDGQHLLRVEATNGADHLGFAESSFTVDTNPPAVTKVTPATGSGSVPVRMSVLVEFAEQIDPASVTTATVSLASQVKAAPGEIRITSDGKGLIFKPQDKLSYGTSYVFTLKAGVRDLLGNAIVSDLTTTFATPMVDPDIVGYWPMDGDWNDYSGYGDNGFGYGTSAFDGGRVPGVQSGSFTIDSALFPGSGGFIYTPAKFIATPDNFTMSFWAKPTATRESTAESNHNVIDGRGVQRFAIAPVDFYNLGYLGATAGVSVGTNGISVIEETTVVDGSMLYGYMPALLVYDSPTPLTGWNHVAVVYNNKQPSLYLNGTLVRTGLASNQYQVYPSALFAYGNERETGSYSGQLEGIAIHGRALTAQDVQTLYQSQSKSVPQITITSPGTDVRYRAGEVGSATISVTSATGINKVYCSATGATSFGGLAIDYEQPQAEINQQLSFQVAADAPPYASILLSCVAQTADGTLGAAQLQLEAADLAPPTVLSSSPSNNAIDVSATMPITIYFSEPVDPASVISRDTFRFQRDDNSAWVSSMYRLSTDNKAMQILPSPALDGSTSYTLTIERLRDLAGNVMTDDFALQFTTLQQTNLEIQNQGTAASPYVLQTGRYGNLTLTNSYVTVSGGVAADTLAMDHSTLNLTTSTSVPSDLSVTFGGSNLTNGSELIVSGSLDLASDLNMNDSLMSVVGTGTVAGNVGLSGSSITLKNSLQVSGGVVLQDSSTLTHFAATKTDTSKLDVIAAYMTVDASSKIDVAGKGYLGGYPEAVVPDTSGYTLGNTRTGGSQNSSGGSYGGQGGGAIVNVAYGDLTDPNDLGSGGGGSYTDFFTGINNVITRIAGGNGGGLIRLTLGSLNLDGTITADGAATTASGGSGGSVYINAGDITGAGSISAKGGSVENGIVAPTGGGGGRIAIYYDALDIPVSNISAGGGTGDDNNESTNGSAGTIYLKNNMRNPDLIVDNLSVVTNKLTPITSGTYGIVNIINNVSATIAAQGATAPVSLYKLDLWADTITVDSTSKIDVSGRGFLGGQVSDNTTSNGMTYDPATQEPTSTGGSSAGAGGSYGGPGGNEWSNTLYGNYQQPNEPGSGGGGRGGNYLGSNGGGAVKLTANVLSLNGSIQANGDNNTTSGGAGSGGAIWINAGAISGSGTLSAKGGSVQHYGGGGGGRIAVYYGSSSIPSVNISATGGKSNTGSNVVANGGAGTIYLKAANKTKGDVIIDNGNITTSNTTPVPGADYGEIVVNGGANASIFGDLSYEGDVTFTGSNLTISGGINARANLTLDGSTITVNGPVNVTNALTLKNGSLLTHGAATATAAYKLDVTAETITLNDTSKIDVSGKGFLGGLVPGNTMITGMTSDPATHGPTTAGGSGTSAGGSYGGLGGAAAANAAYGDYQQPSEPGSGGGGSGANKGANGGGAIKLTTNVLNLSGTGTGILANGSDNMTALAGSGSGGAIWINSGTISGTGTVSAKGGTTHNNAGGGGGGRIAVYYGSSTLSLANISASGGESNSGGTSNNGGAGTIYLKAADRTKGDVIIDNGNITTSNTTSVPGVDYGEIAVNGGANASVFRDLSYEGDVTFTGSLTTTGGITARANLTLDGSTITVNGPVNVTNALTLRNGSLLTHEAATATAAYKLDITAETITLNDTSKIDVSGKGFLGGLVPGNTIITGMTYDPATQGPTTTGGSDTSAGGSYGGLGGAVAANAVYGDYQQPIEPGSGGGGNGTSIGSNGGGAVKLTANALNLSGTGTGILANGTNNYTLYGGGGSGGAIWINAGAISGTGTVSAKGGTAYGGGGGGGRIAVYYGSNSLPLANVSAFGGNCNSGSNVVKNGGAGTIYLKAADKPKGDMVVNNGGFATNNATPVAGGDFGQITVSGSALTNVTADISFENDVTFTGSSLTFSGGITSGANLTLDGSTITVNGPVNVTNALTLRNGSLLTHGAATATAAYKLDVTAETINFNDTSKIDVSGRGFLGGLVPGNTVITGMSYDSATQGPTTAGGSGTSAGGSYGGIGGAVAANAAYGDYQQPREPGSGGGGNGTSLGSNGGGAVKLTANLLNLNGTGTGILANGSNNLTSNGGGGSGGAIWINAGTISGTGILSTKGGTAPSPAGGGGGGRIAVYYGSSSLPLANISAFGGKCNSGSVVNNGGAGTIYLKVADKPKGDIIVNNGGFATNNATPVAGGDVGQITVSGGALTNVTADISFDKDVTFTGSNVTFSGGITSTGNLTLDGSTVTVNGPVNVTHALTLKNGSLLTHSAATATVPYNLDVTAETITLSDTSRIDVSGKGFLGGLTPGNATSKGMTYDPVTQGPTTTGGSNSAVGGSYGGLGSYGVANSGYGIYQQPNEPGSGGGGGSPNPGSSGGGAVKLTAGVLNLAGTGTSILANGNGSGLNVGGGSGGAIWINVGTLSGTGKIAAKGGTAGNYGGGGGGGRIALYYGSNNIPLANISASGGKNNNSAYNGGAGTIYLKAVDKTKGDVILDNGGLATTSTTTVTGGEYGQMTVSGGAKANVSGDISFAQDVTFTGSTLTFSGGITSTGNLTLDGSTITANGPVHVTNVLTLKNGSLLTHGAATETAAYKLDVTAETITLNDTSKIDVSGKGFLGGLVPGNTIIIGMTYDPVTHGPTTAGGSGTTAGGSYGGLGGAGAANAAYGNYQQPSEPGSGGGGSGTNKGANGGGAIKLTANALNLSGTGTGILANGSNNITTKAGGGSGGAIWINVGTISGTGTVSAKGGTAPNYAGGGGGGRIAVYYGSNSLPLASISASGGKCNNSSTSNNGGAGTIYLKAADKPKGDIIVNNDGFVTNNATPIPGGDFGQITVSGGAFTNVTADISFDQDVTFTGSTVTFSGGVTARTNLTLDGSTITANGSVNVTNALTLKNGSLLTHGAATATAAYKLDVTAETITLNDTSKIDVSGKGFLGGLVPGNINNNGMTYDSATQGPTTIGGSSSGTGGGYGGSGGYGLSNALYGNYQEPNEPGSGGGGSGTPYLGSNGGGAVKLATNLLNLNGVSTGVLANGDKNTSYGGGGSGGAIWINAGTISGTGTISTKGGTSSYRGYGGGGRIAVYYNSSTLPLANISASVGAASYKGGDGTVYIYQYVFPLTVTNVGSGFGTVQSTPSGISCSATCSANFGKTSSVNLTAVPAVGSAFMGWSGACSGTGVCTVTMDEAKEVTASFAVIPPPTVSISSPVGVTNNRPLLQYTVSAGTVVVKVDGVVVGNVSGDVLDLPADGTHTIRVEATSNGLTGYAESIVTIDTVAPTLTVDTLPAIIKTATQTLSGTMETGSSVALTVTAGTAIPGTVAYPTSTTWQCMVSDLSVGANTFTITARDQAGNSSAKSLSVTYVLPLGLELSVSSIAANSQGSVVLSVSNIDPIGSNVLVEQLVDANRNGAVDSGDYPIRAFTVSDGVAAVSQKTQGDEDATSDGTMTTTLAFGLTSDIYHARGSYLFQVSNGIEAATAPFTVSPVMHSQSVTGAVTDGTDPVSGAMVRLLDKWQRPVSWTIADETGHFILDIIEPGEYLIVPIAYGFVADPAGTPLTITADQHLTGHNLVMTAGALSLSGTVRKDQATDPVAGVWVQALGANGIGYAITGTDGSYVLRLPIGDYDVAVVADATMPNPAASGYLANTAQPLHVNLQLDTTGIDIALVPADLAVSGTVVDQNGNPLGGMPIFGKLAATADAREPAAFATTDASGNYLLSLVAGNDWTIALDEVVAQPLGYLGNAVRNFSTAGTLTDINFAVRRVTAFIKGTVRDSSANPLGNADVKLRNADSTIVMQLRTAADGTYRFGTYGGDWYLNAYPGQVGEQTATVTDGQTATIDLVVDSVPPEVTIASPTATTPDNTPQLIYNVSEGTVVVKVDNVVVNKVSGDSLDQVSNGEHTVVVESIDAAGNLNSASVTFNVNYAPLEIETNTVADGTVGTAFSQLLVAKGGVAPYDWTLSNGSIPTGLTLDRVTGIISGTPVVAETSTFTVRVTDSDGSEATQQYTLLLAPN